MKKPRVIVCLLLGLAILGIFWFLADRPSQQEAGIQSPPRKGSRGGAPPASGQQVLANLKDAFNSKGAVMQEGMASLNDRPVEFFGKAEDQFGAPVVDAEVIADVLVRNGTTAGVEQIRQRTDSEGIFRISGYKGESLEVGVRKVPGYYNGRVKGEKTQGFLAVYSAMWPAAERHTPNPHKPVVFKMWKLTGPEPMMEIEGYHRIAHDGSPITFDWLTGKRTKSGGDFRIALWQGEPTKVGWELRGDWGFTIEAVDGGFVETTDDFMYLAPESGYRPKIEYRVSPTNWTSDVKRQLYVKTRGGKHVSRLVMSVRCSYTHPEGVLEVQGYMNPLGSRNLEWDPHGRLTPARIAMIGFERAVQEAKDRLPGQ